METHESTAAAADDDGRPYVLIVSHVLMGHLSPMLRIASALRGQGWPVFWLGPTAHRGRLEASGAVFLPLRGDADLDDRLYYERPPFEGYGALPWHERVLVDLERQCVATLPTQWACLKDALRDLRARDKGKDKKKRRQILVLAEAFFFGALPLRHGAPLHPDMDESERPRSICVSVTVPAIRSQDLPPIGYPFPFDSSPEGRTRNARLWERSWARRTAPLMALLEAKMREVGATKPLPGKIFLEGANYLCHERILQLGVPGFEYPRTDWPANFRFAGLVQGPPAPALPANGATTTTTTTTTSTTPTTTTTPAVAAKKTKDPDFPWWPELVANSALGRDDPRRKKVVVVTQGTVEINPEDLILPTIRAFAPSASPASPAGNNTASTTSTIDPDNVLVIAILGWKGARLTYTPTPTPSSSSSSSPSASLTTTTTTATPEGETPLPPNARTADYLSYDAALVHADAWVHNAGFGAVCHGIAHGVPMVCAGEGMDKGENARRVAWCGVGVDLERGRPSAEQVREGVARVLRDGEGGGRGGSGGFREKVEALRRESEARDAFGVIGEELWRLVA